jgi:prepilin-type N-terminal cleavage/methylation domain-containing protein
VTTMRGNPKSGMAQPGFSLLETLVAVAMLSALTLLVAPLVSDQLSRGDNQRYAAEAVDALREAQANVMSGKNNARYGVHFESTKFVLFQGSTYSGGDSNNVTHAMTADTTVTAISLSPGGSCTLSTGSGNCDVHFSSRKGVPTESGTITFTTSGSTVRTVTVNAAGMTEWQ